MKRDKAAFIVFFIVTLALTWALIGQIIQSQMTVDKLIKVKGIVESTQEVATHVQKKIFSTHKDLELRIYLRDTSEYFRIMNVYKYSRFLGQIHQGDTAEIYIRPKWLVPLGLGYRNDVFQLNINRKTIFDISETHSNEYGIIIVLIIGIPSFILLGRRLIRKVREEEKKRAAK